jgi:ParB-like chromosome segregation protein Spo0J
MQIALAQIYPGPRARLPVKARVTAMAASIERIGLHTPITVKPAHRVVNGQRAAVWEIVVGHHRFEAARKLGWSEIAAEVIEDEAQARMWEISENLHRADLSPVERAEHIEEWRRLIGEKVSQVGTPVAERSRGGRQPDAAGVRETARQLNVPKQEVSRARKIAAIPQETRDQAREERWPATQLLREAEPSEPTLSTPEPRPEIEAMQTQISALMRAWAAAGPEAREGFLRRVGALV